MVGSWDAIRFGGGLEPWDVAAVFSTGCLVPSCTKYMGVRIVG